MTTLCFIKICPFSTGSILWNWNISKLQPWHKSIALAKTIAQWYGSREREILHICYQSTRSVNEELCGIWADMLLHVCLEFWLMLNSHLRGSLPLCRWAWVGWCARTGRCSCPWCHREVDMGLWCQGHTDSSVPSGTCFHPNGPTSGGRMPVCQSSRWSHSANV